MQGDGNKWNYNKSVCDSSHPSLSAVLVCCFFPYIFSPYPHSLYIISFLHLPLHTVICIIFSPLLSPPSPLLFIYTLLTASPPLLLYPCLSCQGVYIRPARGRVPNKVEKIRGEKTALLPARVSLSLCLLLSFSLFLSLSDSGYISANVLLTSSTPMEYQQKLLSTLLTAMVLKNTRKGVTFLKIWRTSALHLLQCTLLLWTKSPLKMTLFLVLDALHFLILSLQLCNMHLFYIIELLLIPLLPFSSFSCFPLSTDPKDKM